MGLRRHGILRLLLWCAFLLTIGPNFGQTQNPSYFGYFRSSTKIQSYSYNAYRLGGSLFVSAGESHIDATIRATLRTKRDFFFDVQVIRFDTNFILIPIADTPTSGEPDSTRSRVQINVKLIDLRKGSYTIYVMKRHPVTGEEHLGTRIVEVSGTSHMTYLPSVDRADISLGDGYIDVVILGSLDASTDSLFEVQITKLNRQITLIPVAQTPSSGKADGVITPFQTTIHIDHLNTSNRSYTIYVIGREKDTGQGHVVIERSKAR